MLIACSLNISCSAGKQSNCNYECTSYSWLPSWRGPGFLVSEDSDIDGAEVLSLTPTWDCGRQNQRNFWKLNPELFPPRGSTPMTPPPWSWPWGKGMWGSEKQGQLPFSTDNRATKEQNRHTWWHRKWQMSQQNSSNKWSLFTFPVFLFHFSKAYSN